MTWMLIAGCEIHCEGTKEECIERFENYPNPLPMRLLYIAGEFEIFRTQDINRKVVVGKAI